MDAQKAEASPRSALPSAAPPVWARAVAIGAIIVAGVAGALIGWSAFTLQCEEDCHTAAAIGAVVSALVCAIGVAVVAVLTLRAMSEWKAIEARDRARRERGLS